MLARLGTVMHEEGSVPLRTMLVGGALALAVCLPRAGPTQAAPSRQPPPRERPTGPVEAGRCLECHTEVAAFDQLHGPVTVNACAACHRLESVEAHTYSLVRQGAALCTYCHDLDMQGAIHEPLVTGDCLGCHDPHGGPDRQLLKAATLDQLCSSCHEGVTGAAQHVHGPAAVGACSVCHVPHASPHPGLLAAPVVELCNGCHVDTSVQMDTQRNVHAPVAEDCTTCHLPHEADDPMLLRERTQALCLGCHDAVRHTVETAMTQHAAVTTERTCLNCHDPHASNHPRLLSSDMKTLCFECHDREIKMPDGTTLGNIKKVIASGTSLHGPVAQSNCAACHMIHGGDNFRMLVKEYPAEFYAPFAEEDYALCFSCHEKHLVLEPRTTALTDFRNGDLNLHYLHVNKERKGRTCRACHETHASSKAKQIRDSVPFGPGGWELPIGFEKTATGGSCAPGCHVPYAYDRENPVPLPELRRPAIWPTEEAGGS